MHTLELIHPQINYRFKSASSGRTEKGKIRWPGPDLLFAKCRCEGPMKVRCARSSSPACQGNQITPKLTFTLIRYSPTFATPQTFLMRQSYIKGIAEYNGEGSAERLSSLRKAFVYAREGGSTLSWERFLDGADEEGKKVTTFATLLRQAQQADYLELEDPDEIGRTEFVQVSGPDPILIPSKRTPHGRTRLAFASAAAPAQAPWLTFVWITVCLRLWTFSTRTLRT